MNNADNTALPFTTATSLLISKLYNSWKPYKCIRSKNIDSTGMGALYIHQCITYYTVHTCEPQFVIRLDSLYPEIISAVEFQVAVSR